MGQYIGDRLSVDILFMEQGLVIGRIIGSGIVIV